MSNWGSAKKDLHPRVIKITGCLIVCLAGGRSLHLDSQLIRQKAQRLSLPGPGGTPLEPRLGSGAQADRL